MKILDKIPFDKLRIAYFRAYDKPHEKVFLDATDEQILNLLAREYCETVVIMKIEEVNVLEVVTHIPKKRKLNLDELKMGKVDSARSLEEENAEKLRKKYPR